MLLNMVTAITGHRPDKLGGWKPCPEHDLVKAGILAALTEMRPKVLLTGMALGTDQWAAEVAINLGIPFVPFLPFKGFEAKWPPKSQLHFNWLLSCAAQDPVIVCEGGYDQWKMDARNHWLVDNCEVLLAVYNGTPGGTQRTLEYALSKGKPIEYVRFGAQVQQIHPRSVTDFVDPLTNRASVAEEISRRQPAPQGPEREPLVVRPRVHRIIEE